MCGFILTNGPTSVWEKWSLSHRGPDQAVSFRGHGLSVDFFRLAIVGGSAGDAPVSSDDGSWKVFLNGEVYNYRKLQSQYGLPETGSDTKTLANGLSRLGLTFFNDLRGMFAGVAINANSDEVLVFRDALGEKPLFYSQTGTQTIVSSEVRPIIGSLGGLSASPEALSDYARFGYVEEPKTIDSRIWAFPRGTVQSLDTKTGSFTKVSTLSGYGSSETTAHLPELIEEVFAEIGYSEVPVSLLLSGGFDSGALLTMLCKSYENNRPQPISISFKPKLSEVRPRANHAIRLESWRAQKTSRNLGLKTTRVRVDKKDVEYWLWELVKASDQPHADPSGIGYLVAFRESRRQGRKVAFVGHGADEFFWGYPWLNDYLKLRELKTPPVENVECYWPESLLVGQAAVPLQASIRDFGSSDSFLASSNPWIRSRAFQTHSYLNHNGFAQVDRLAMSQGVEARSPWADSRLYGWAQSNAVANSSDALGKSLLKSSADLGRNNRIKGYEKKGFLSPVDAWLEQTTGKDTEDHFEKGLAILESAGLEISETGTLPSQGRLRVTILGMWQSLLVDQPIALNALG